MRAPRLAALRRVDRGWVIAEHLDVAAEAGQEPGDGQKRRGLAGAVRAEQRDDLAGLDVEVDAVHDGHTAVARDQPAKLERRQPGLQCGAVASYDPAQVRRDDRRILAYGDRRAGRDDAAEVQDGELVADVEHQRHVVIDEQYADTRAGERPQHLAELGRLGRVEAGRGFVEQDEPSG